MTRAFVHGLREEDVEPDGLGVVEPVHRDGELARIRLVRKRCLEIVPDGAARAEVTVAAAADEAVLAAERITELHADALLPRTVEDFDGRLVHVADGRIAVEHAEADFRRRENGTHIGVVALDLAREAAHARDVAQDDGTARHTAVDMHDGRASRRKVDRLVPAVDADVARKADGRAAFHRLFERVFIGTVAANPDEAADVHAFHAADVLALAAEDAHGGRVDECDALVLVRQDDTVADAAEQPLQDFGRHAALLCPHHSFHLFSKTNQACAAARMAPAMASSGSWRSTAPSS